MATEESGTINEEFYMADKPTNNGSESEDDLNKRVEMWEQNLVNLAMLAEKAERYEDMCKYLTDVVVSKFNRKQSLLENERNLLSVAFKNVVGGLRSSWRTFKGEQTENAELTEAYCSIVEHELEQKCLQVLKILEDKLIPTCEKEGESRVFFLKMCGDYYRYLAEFRDKEQYKESAKTNYENAYDAAKGSLAETHPTRLGLALNFSVCYYEILKEHQKACTLAKRAFDEAIQKLDTLNDANYKDSTLIMQLLRDNLTLWTSENNEENED